MLAERYGVTRLALFGSTARGEAHPDSDVDIAVGFDGRPRRRGTSACSSTLTMCRVALSTLERIGHASGAETVHRTRGRECLKASGVTTWKRPTPW